MKSFITSLRKGGLNMEISRAFIHNSLATFSTSLIRTLHEYPPTMPFSTHHPKISDSLPFNNIFPPDGEPWKNIRRKPSPTFTSGKMQMILLLVKTQGLSELTGNATKNGENHEMKAVLVRFASDVPGKNYTSELRKFSEEEFSFSFHQLFLVLISSMTLPNRHLLESKRLSSTIEFSRGDFPWKKMQANAASSSLQLFKKSSTTMSFAVLELAQNQDIEAKLREVLKKHDGVLPHGALQEMSCCENVVQETLRKYHPRVRTKDYKIPESDATIKKGTIVNIPIRILQNDPGYVSNPDPFNPEKFDNETKSKIVEYTYMPFREGPRQSLSEIIHNSNAAFVEDLIT
ncbi:probable cytochrome P450 6a20 [Euwallacea fornicatus]|uniref:probable cytochrome P450 6a20 n=1 Tax=Euwallacea fornicatus TaxID=995702 RepID=UPI00338D4542